MKAEDEIEELEQNSVSYQGFSNGVEVYTFTHDELARYKKLVIESKLQALKDRDKLGQVFMNKFDCYNGIEGDGQEFPAMTKDKFVEVVSNLITNLEDND